MAMMHNLAMTHLRRYVIHMPVDAGKERKVHAFQRSKRESPKAAARSFDAGSSYSAVAGAGAVAVVRLFAVSTVHSAAIMTGQVKMKTNFDVAVQRAQSTAISGLVHSSPTCRSVRAQSTTQSTVNQSEHSQTVRAQSISQSTVNQSQSQSEHDQKADVEQHGGWIMHMALTLCTQS